MSRRTPVIRSIDGITRPLPKRSIRARFSQRVKKSRKARAAILVAVALCILGGSVVALNRMRTPNYNDVTTITKALKNHVLVPDEPPILATVTDKTALRTPFLKESENGDRIVIYPKAKKVIIYRPSVDRVVSIGPVDVNNIPKVTR